MKAILSLILGLGVILSAATCSDKSKAYSNGYSSVAKQLKESTNDADPMKMKAMMSSFANTTCDIGCQSEAAKAKSALENQKKYFTCYDVCLKGAQDALKGSKPKMKLCEEDKK